MNSNTRAMPIAPATMAARSESLPNVAETFSTCSLVRVIGNAPEFSTCASLSASEWLKLPVIWTLPVNVGACTTGADWISPSSSIASWCDGHVSPRLSRCVATAFQTPSPSPPPRRPTVTPHRPSMMRASAESLENTVPSPALGPTWQAPPSRFGRTCDLVGSEYGSTVDGVDEPSLVGVVGAVVVELAGSAGGAVVTRRDGPGEPVPTEAASV